MAQLNFNAAEVAPDAGYGDPLPDGWYNVMADDSEVKPASNNASTGNCFLSMRFVVLDGDFKGRKLFTRFNIRNSNPVAQEIAYKQLSAVAHAVGVLMVQDSMQLHGIPLKVRVKVVSGQLKDKQNPAAGVYDPSNDIVSYKNINEVVQQPVAVHAPVAGGFPAQVAPTQQFQAPAAQAAPAMPNPAQWAQPAVQQFAPPVQQAAAAAPQFAQQTTAPQFAPQQQFTPPAQQAAPQQFAPPSFSPPVQQAAAPVQQFAAPVQQAPAQQQAPAAAPAEAPAPAQSATPPWARPAA